MINIKIARDFSPYPGPRYISEGKYSGEEFRNTILVPAINIALLNKDFISIDLDGTSGYSTAFLEEAFGGLIRLKIIDYSVLTHILKFYSCDEPYLIDDIHNYIYIAEQYRIHHNLPLVKSK